MPQSTSSKQFTRTLSDLNNLANSEFIKGKRLEDFAVPDLKKMKSEDWRHLCQKKIEDLGDQILKTREKLPNEEVTRFEQLETKRLTEALNDFRDQCAKDGLSTREFEEESVKFITDKYKRFFFSSKWAQRLYKLNNAVASTSLGYWGYRSVGALGTTNRILLQKELSKSILPIAFYTGITCRFWAYICSCRGWTSLSKFFDGASHIAMSPIMLVESLINGVINPIFKATPLKTEIPLNITGHVASGSGLTWDKLTHTYQFVENMTKNWEKPPS